jgi:putative transposase
MSVLKMIFLSVRALIVSRAELSLELLALRQQLVVLRRTVLRPEIHRGDRLFWIVLSRIWQDWQKSLVIVKPKTVIKWHRQGFKMYWRWRSRTRNSGRPKVDKEIQELIGRISQENPLWGIPRIQSELRLLGYDVAASTVAKYRIRGTKPPSQTWRTFLDNHVDQIAAVDFFTVPTLSFRVLFCFLVLRHDRRKVIHFNVSEHPTALWTGQQMVEAFPEDSAPRYLLRDQDQIYGDEFCQRLKGLGMEEVMTAPQSPFQNPYAERIVGSIRRECLDHVMVLNENHLRAILRCPLPKSCPC